MEVLLGLTPPVLAALEQSYKVRKCICGLLTATIYRVATEKVYFSPYCSRNIITSFIETPCMLHSSQLDEKEQGGDFRETTDYII